jgi:hypothetical protein
MVPVMSLWLPILLSAVLVFIVSSIVHMVLPHHRTDYAPLPDEDGVRAALRPFAVPPGDYAVPYAASPKEMGAPAFVARMEEGPVALLTVRPSGPPRMGANLLQWFVYTLIVGVLAAYVTSRAIGAGGEYLDVFRFAGTTAFAAYAMALPSSSIWFGRKWSTTLKMMADGLVYALLTAGVFGWLWPY